MEIITTSFEIILPAECGAGDITGKIEEIVLSSGFKEG